MTTQDEKEKEKEKHAGGRPKGARNIPKSAKELLGLLEAEYKKQGKRFTFNIDDSEPDKDDKTPPKGFFPDFELDLGKEADEKETYKCGACNASLDDMEDKCPYCGAKLSW